MGRLAMGPLLVESPGLRAGRGLYASVLRIIIGGGLGAAGVLSQENHDYNDYARQAVHGE